MTSDIYISQEEAVSQLYPIWLARQAKESQRFWSKVSLVGNTCECWLWVGNWVRGGYGQFKSDGRGVEAHRWAYESTVGIIPAGLDLDHLCRVRLCVNPYHLEPVTRRENIMRGEGVAAAHASKTHCPYGHSFTGDNLVLRPRGGRSCRECQRRWSREYRARRKVISCQN